MLKKRNDYFIVIYFMLLKIINNKNNLEGEDRLSSALSG